MPTLPSELQREIFEIAVRSGRGDKLHLRLVAHHVQSWVDMLVYELLKISGDNADKFLELADLKAPGFFAAAVKTLHLCFTTPDQTSRILSLCSGVQALVVWLEDFPQAALSSVSQLPLQRLSMKFQFVASIITAASPLTWLTWRSTITHLDMAFETMYMDTPALQKLQQLPRLTHVALPLKAGPRHAQTVCSSCPNLQVLVMLDRDEIKAAAIDTYVFDSRIVLARYPYDARDEWEAGAANFGLTDMWTRAERVLARRNV